MPKAADPSLLQMDPTRTATLRRAFGDRINKEFSQLYGDTVKLIVADDAFGITRKPFVITNVGTEHKFASTMVLADPYVTAAVLDIQRAIDPDDVVKLEDEPHITVRYGLHDGPDAAGKAALIAADTGAVTATVLRLSLFRNDDADVLKYEIKSPGLTALNRRLGMLANTQTYAYNPHMTVAYLKPGTGDKYVRPTTLDGLYLAFDRLIYSSVDHDYTPITLNFVRDTLGRFAHTAGAGGIKAFHLAKQAGTKFSHVEHVAKEWVSSNLSSGVAKLPWGIRHTVEGSFVAGKVGLSTAFLSWKIGQQLAEKVAKEKGLTDEQAKKLRGVLSGLDVTLLKPVQIIGAATGISHATLGIVSFIPPATAGYLAYSTARNPLATFRAAKFLTNDYVDKAHAAGKWAISKLTGNAEADNVLFIEGALARHNYDDWYIAIFTAALEDTGDVREAVSVADQVYAATPTPPQEEGVANAFCPTGEGGGVDPHCGKGEPQGGSTVFRGMTHYQSTKAVLGGLKLGAQWQDRPPSVYFTTDEAHAAKYAQMAGGNLGAVVEFVLPHNHPVKVDELDKHAAYRTEQEIPARYIKAIHKHDRDGKRVETIPNPHFNPITTNAAGGQAVFAPVVIGGPTANNNPEGHNQYTHGEHTLSPVAKEFMATARYNGNAGRKPIHELPAAKLEKFVRSYSAQVLAAGRMGKHDVAQELAAAAPHIIPGARPIGSVGDVVTFDGNKHDYGKDVVLTPGLLKGMVRIKRTGVGYRNAQKFGEGESFGTIAHAHVEPAGPIINSNPEGHNQYTGLAHLTKPTLKPAELDPTDTMGQGVKRFVVGKKAALKFGTVEKVRIADVTATQTYLNPAKLQELIVKPSGDKPIFVRQGGKVYVGDGHHRIEVEKAKGHEHVEGHVIDVDEHGHPTHKPTVNTQFAFPTDPQKLEAFRGWLKTQIKKRITGDDAKKLWEAYVQEGFKKGAGRAYDDYKKKAPAGDDDQLSFYKGARTQFLQSAFAQPVAVETVQLLAGRSFDELENISTDMSTKITRTLTDGLVQGKSPIDIARDIKNQIGISKDRAETIARTEIIRAHAEGQLIAYEAMGVDELGVAVEWTTGGRNVCPLCGIMQGVVLSIQEAKGMIPRHPRCKCAWIPANVREDTKGQKRTAPKIKAAIKDAADDSDWGPGEPISKTRPESVLNRLLTLLVNYDPHQLRVPAGRPGGGQFQGGHTPAIAGTPPVHASELSYVKDLPGSTNPKLMKDKHGKQWVLKTGKEGQQDRLMNEATADKLYRIVGASVPRSGIIEDHGGHRKVSEYIEGGQTLQDWKKGKTAEEITGMYKKIGQHMAADALFANWDVVGLNHDNILIKGDKVYRIDNGGSLKFRAQGAPKGNLFGTTVSELDSLRDVHGKNKAASEVFKHVSDGDLRMQMISILDKKPQILAAITDKETYDIVKGRLDDFQNRLDNGFGWAKKLPVIAPPVVPPPPAPTPKPHAPTPPQETGAGFQPNMHSAAGVVAYIHEKKGAVPFSPLYSAKLEHMNPNGVKGGVFFIPTFPKGEKSSLEKVAKLVEILPAGTVIKQKSVTAKDVEYLLTPEHVEKAKQLAEKMKAGKSAGGIDPNTGLYDPSVPKAKKEHAVGMDHPKVKKALKSISDAPAPKSAEDLVALKKSLLGGDFLTYSKLNAKIYELSKNTLGGTDSMKKAWFVKELMSFLGKKNSLPTYGTINAAKLNKLKVVAGLKEASSAPSSTHTPSTPKTVQAPTIPPVGAYTNVTKKASPQPKDHADTWKKSLSTDEKHAVQAWSDGGYGGIRKRIQAGTPNAIDTHFINALNKQTPLPGEYYRGIKTHSHKTDDYGQTQIDMIKAAGVGGSWTDLAPHSLSRSPSTGINFSNGSSYPPSPNNPDFKGLVLTVRSKTARPIENVSSLPGETELIGLHGTKYKIVGYQENATVLDAHGNPHYVRMHAILEEI